MKPGYPAGAALVTGGSGGIGSAVVSSLAGLGIAVGFTYRARKEAAEALVLRLAGGAPVAAHRWSGADAREAADLLGRVTGELGPVRYLVSCHGLAQESAFHALSEKEWLEILETNLTSNLALARAAVTPMMKAGFGRIVLVTSVSGQRGIPGHTVYAASKAGLGGFARSLAHECAAFGVTVNAVAPGYIDTPMLDGIPEKTRKALLDRIPARRLGSPEDVAHVVRFLLSEQAGYVTGQTWAVDGGLSS